MEFCKNCGNPKRKETDKVCTSCGNPFPPPKVVESPTNTELRTEKREKKNSSLKWVVGGVSTLVVAGGLGFGYFYAKNTYGVESFVTKAEKAIRNNDISYLEDVIKTSDNILITREDAKKFLEDVADSSSTQKKILASLEEQKEAILSGKKREAFVLKVQESPEKKWFVIPQYELGMVPVKIEFEVPSDATVSVNDKNVKVDDEGRVSLTNMIPGLYSIEIKDDSDDTTADIEAWDTTSMDTEPIENAIEELTEATVVLADAVDEDSSSSEVSLSNLQEFIDEYLRAGVQTFNSRDMQYIKPYIEPNSQELKNTSDYLVTLSEKGIYEELLNAEVLHYEEVSKDVYNVTVFSKYNISFNNGETKRFQSYNVVYQLVKDGDSFLCRKIIKEEMVEKREI